MTSVHSIVRSLPIDLISYIKLTAITTINIIIIIMSSVRHWILIAFLFLTNMQKIQGLEEEDRLREYHARNHTWPLTEVVPNTPGWAKLMTRRFKQVEKIPDSNQRYNAWMQVMSSALVSPNFTENGWGLARAPAHLVEELQQKIRDNLHNATYENKVDVIEGLHHTKEETPLFIPNFELNDRVLRELKPLHEEWSGVQLVGEIAYGLRLYQNNSRLLMHVDKSATHIISCILHIDHSEDSEPWPIIIEDFQGNTNEVVLEPGDMLFYESSKCLHGRPHYFKGSWYSSIFVHYYPVGWDGNARVMDTHYAVPPIWSVDPVPGENDDDDDEYVEELVMVGTSMKEPECEHVWCALKESVKWYGPGKEGITITTGYKDESNVIMAQEEL